jgi:hypothetical protein
MRQSGSVCAVWLESGAVVAFDDAVYRYQNLAQPRIQPDLVPMTENPEPSTPEAAAPATMPKPPLPKEIGGPKGPEPTRYGDWEVKGRCSDF